MLSGVPHAAGLGVQPKIVKKTSTDALEAKIDLLKTLLEAGDLTQEAFEKRQSELQDAMTDVEKVEAAQEVVAQTDGEPSQKDGKEVKRKRKTFTEVAKFATKNEAVNWLQQEDRCYKRINSSKSYKGGPLGAIYRCVLHKNCPHMIRLWFCRQDEMWHLSESGEHDEEFNITQNRISPFLKQRLIPLLKKDDGRPVKVLEQLKAEAKESNDTVMQQMLEEVTYKQIAALRRGVIKNLQPQMPAPGEAAAAMAQVTLPVEVPQDMIGEEPKAEEVVVHSPQPPPPPQP